VKAEKRSARTAAVQRALKTSQEEAGERFFESVVTGWTDRAVSILLRLYLDQTPLAKLLDQLVAGTMRRVGEDWHRGLMTVADEHLATRTMMRTLDAVSNLLRAERPNGRTAICCAVEDELHEIAVHCAQVLLESEGWGVINLGANTPFFTLAQAVEKHRPQVVCVSSTMNSALDRSAREYPLLRAAAEKAEARMVLGGEGFREQIVRVRFPAELHAESFQALQEYIRPGAEPERRAGKEKDEETEESPAH
jgi:methanogenic corrinoid protein MtbC1